MPGTRLEFIGGCNMEDVSGLNAELILLQLTKCNARMLHPAWG
jgi:hypothetical protein